MLSIKQRRIYKQDLGNSVVAPVHPIESASWLQVVIHTTPPESPRKGVIVLSKFALSTGWILIARVSNSFRHVSLYHYK